ncbi:MAG TPA: hypothetical protein VL121_18435 [Agriterribacter sp.]|nr:hypothetical protein [Agriterribacter sp.]
MIKIPNIETPVSPGSAVGGVLIINTTKAEVARLLTIAGQPPKVLSSAAIVGQKGLFSYLKALMMNMRIAWQHYIHLEKSRFLLFINKYKRIQ